jgi:hypothetical protein
MRPTPCELSAFATFLEADLSPSVSWNLHFSGIKRRFLDEREVATLMWSLVKLALDTACATLMRFREPVLCPLLGCKRGRMRSNMYANGSTSSATFRRALTAGPSVT